MMKIKLLAITIVSAFALSVQAGFFGSDHNWNNPVSAAMDAMSDMASDAKNTVSDAVDSVTDSVDVGSLRGTHALDDFSLMPPVGKWIKDADFTRSFIDQPPLIPHKTKGMRITMKKNKCLSCHSNENWRDADAVKMTASHFMTRSNKRLKEVSPRRYFCTQCHVPQVDNKPLIGSDYVNTAE
ncbi:nitrate reductase cytochrome c-type subunit [Candidatus Thioglobus sp.]|jgi:cytochrome c-type protein NapB|uniref:nitrate reductase cytochrome c-type subunit n=1 Tax=Candidatus Thioglobus sp. TaxID=2026721 RepID=UPI001EB684C9|nr:nitrate reductase cytochrome c-type subunit [Candidatus Thioglobus sp.]MBT3186492.1 nitrate reductase cytochrome c-type subunit [Candidatus Thioglobus sp.]MBT4315878.1 nitrate reductase cytochrome c-type subunit [Candidatus Thioglobus sp.]MBT6655335.1 nitrate reductase cytochrome c-type subunit [Candidatus Thioglobus sp.]